MTDAEYHELARKGVPASVICWHKASKDPTVSDAQRQLAARETINHLLNAVIAVTAERDAPSWVCPKCDCRVTRTDSDGTCPNGCGPMRHETWREVAELSQANEESNGETFDELNAAVARAGFEIAGQIEGEPQDPQVCDSYAEVVDRLAQRVAELRTILVGVVICDDHRRQGEYGDPTCRVCVKGRALIESLEK